MVLTARIQTSRKIILTTTPNIDGQHITEYLGIVAGEAIMGANVFRDLMASITDIVGGRSGAYEAELVKARQIALNEMAQYADQLEADAVLSIDLDYEVVREGMLMVTASGTAVKLSE